jgi:hypothetical protein
LKVKLPEILGQGTTALQDTIVHQFLLFVNKSSDFAKEREKIFKAFSTHANNLMMNPQHNSSDNAVDLQRYVYHVHSH